MLTPSITDDKWRKFVVPSKNLADAFDAAGDKVRKNATMRFEEAPWVDEYWENIINKSIPFAWKWRNKSGWDNSTSRQYMLRLADIILLKAEAMNELSQPITAVSDVVQQVRGRVA